MKEGLDLFFEYINKALEELSNLNISKIGTTIKVNNLDYEILISEKDKKVKNE